MLTVLITGTSRGIGLGLVKEFVKKPNFRVVATCRNPSEASALQELKREVGAEKLLVLPLDVNSAASHEELKRSLSATGVSSVDILLANAGVANGLEVASASVVEKARLDFETNVIGVMLTLLSYQELVLASRLKIFAIMSSGWGSLDLAANSTSAVYATYRMSKAAVNMFGVCFSSEPVVQENRAKVLILNPGWVQTDMGGASAILTVEQSSQGMVDVFDVAAAVQLKKDQEKPIPSQFQAFHQQLSTKSVAFVEYNGALLNW